MMLEVVERSLISIKHRLQHHPTFIFVLRCQQHCCIRSAITFNSVERAHALWLSVSMVIVLFVASVLRVATSVQATEGDQAKS